MAIDRLPSGSFRARLMIDGQRYTSSFSTEADAGRWEVEVRAAAVRRRSVASVTFGVYAEDWLAGFIDEATDRARFGAALERRLLPALGKLALSEVLESDRSALGRRLLQAGVDVDDRSAWECLRAIVEDAADELRVGALDAGVPAGVGRSHG